MANTPNVVTFDELKKVAHELGSQTGNAKDAQVKFAVAIVNGAFHGAIDLKDDKHGKGKDDAFVLAAEYVKAQTGSTHFDNKAGNQQKLMSWNRSYIRWGQWPHGGPGEPIASMNAAISYYAKLRADPANKGKLEDCNNFLLKIARIQVKRESLIEQEEIHDLAFKKEKGERTVEQRIKSVHKELEALEKVDSNKHLKAALTEVSSRLREMTEERAKQAAAAKRARDANAKLQKSRSAKPVTVAVLGPTA